MKKLVYLLIASCLVLGLLFSVVAKVNHGKGPYPAGYGGHGHGSGHDSGHGDDGHGSDHDGHGEDASHGDDEHSTPVANEALRFYIF